MKLLRLRLENFRQHSVCEVEFRDGMTAIVGSNGSGKSTLLESVTFALYGEQRGKLETVRFYWADSKKYSALVAFELDGRQFEVERSTNDASLKELGEKGQVWATGKDPITRNLLRHTSPGQ